MGLELGQTAKECGAGFWICFGHGKGLICMGYTWFKLGRAGSQKLEENNASTISCIFHILDLLCILYSLSVDWDAKHNQLKEEQKLECAC